MNPASKSQCIPFRELPHTTELFATFLEDFDRVSHYYAHPPTGQGILNASREIRLDPQTRAGVVEVLREQNQHLGAGDETKRNLNRLANGAIAIVTGQQVGLFSGPIYTFFKAIAAARIAAEITKRGVDAVPVFWLATEDHDLAEVDHTFLKTNSGLARIELNPPFEMQGRRVGEIRFGEAIEPLGSQVLAGLEGPFAAEVGLAVRESYTPADTFGSSYGKLLARLLPQHGLILIDPLDDRLHRLASKVFRHALHQAYSLREALAQRSKELESAGFHAQVKVAAGSTVLFYNVDGRRQPIRSRNGKFLAGDVELSLDELDGAIESTPDAITPSVLLRPVFQDALLPTAAYIGGPSEVAYMAQAQVSYMLILGRMPAILPRPSFTLVESTVARVLSKFDLDLRDILRGSQHVRSKMEQKAVPNALGRQFEEDEEKLRAMLRQYSQPIEKLDPTLLGTLATAEEKMLYQFQKLKEKVGRAENFRTGILETKQRILFDSLYPNHDLQERSLCGLPFIAAYGPSLFDELARLSDVPATADARECARQHHLLFL